MTLGKGELLEFHYTIAPQGPCHEAEAHVNCHIDALRNLLRTTSRVSALVCQSPTPYTADEHRRCVILI
jgi:hypothetical protein